MEVISGTESPWSRHQEFLIELVEPDFGLVDKLLDNGVLSNKEKADIKSKRTVYKRNSKLLDHILAKEQYDGFIEALKSSNQTHVVNYLEKNGIYASDDDWPLLERERKILGTNQKALIDLLDVQDLCILLYSAGVINRRQRDFISSKPTPYENNEALLDILSRRSIMDYKETIRCLHASKQSHIAQILNEGGVVVRAHGEIPDDRTEDEMISLFVNLLNNRSTEGSRRILEGTLNVIGVKKGDSIVLYIYCKTLDELLNLHKLKTCGKLVTVLQKMFVDVLLLAECAEVTVENPTKVNELPSTEIYQRSQIEKMTAAIHDKEYDKAEKYFLIEGESTTDQLGHFSLEPAKVDEVECEVEKTQAYRNEEKVKTEDGYPATMNPEIFVMNDISEIPKIITDKYLINKGGFGEVYGPITWKEEICAIKRITFVKNDDRESRLRKKKDMWISLSFENVIKIMEVFAKPSVMYIVMEYAEGGSLRLTLDKCKPLSNNVVLDWAKQTADGMLYLHYRGIVHRNLKSSNVILAKLFNPSSPDDKITLKIADFDEMQEHSGTVTMTFQGAYGSVAPEVLITERFSKSSDVWSYGVVVWEMLTGDLPHKTLSHLEIIKKAEAGTLAPPLPEKIPETLSQLLKYCFRLEGNNRPYFRGIEDIFWNSTTAVT